VVCNVDVVHQKVQLKVFMTSLRSNYRSLLDKSEKHAQSFDVPCTHDCFLLISLQELGKPLYPHPVKPSQGVNPVISSANH
jgi:hypothetical protein